MNDNSGNMKQFTQEDIRRYMQGEMSAPEMHAMELAALDDPFLTEAMEGFDKAINETGAEKIYETRTVLQNDFLERLNRKKEKAPVLNIRWWQAAAAAVVIGTAGILGYNAFDNRNDQVVLSLNDSASSRRPETVRAENANMNDKADGSPSAVATEQDLASVPDANKQEEKIPGRNADPAARTKSKNESKADQKTSKEVADKPVQTEINSNESPANSQDVALNQQQTYSKKATEEERSKSLAASDSNLIDDVIVKSSAPVNAQLKKTAPTYTNSARKKKRTGSDSLELSGKITGISYHENGPVENNAINQNLVKNYFSGQIMNSNNQPLSNAILNMVNDKVAYRTDNNGFFQIPAKDSVIEFDVTMAGQLPGRFKITKSDAANQLIIPGSEAALSEVVVTGYASRNKKDNNNTVVLKIQDAEPIGGWLAFDKYIVENKSKTLSLSPSKEMEITFVVSKDQALSDFRITRSISPAHDIEALRLVKEGPKWRLLKGKKAIVNFNLTF